MLRVLLRPLRPRLMAAGGGMLGRESQTRDLGSSPSTRAPIKNVAVIGSGLMGSGIAQVTS